VAARSLKVFTLTVRATSVGWGRQGVFWLLDFGPARVDPLAAGCRCQSQRRDLLTLRTWD